MKANKGFSLIEVLFALVILAVVVSYSTSGFLMLSERLGFSGAASSMNGDINSMFRTLNMSLQNVIKLSPGESLISTGDDLYKGIAGFTPRARECMTSRDGKLQSLRWTRIDLQAQPQRLLRAWEEAVFPDPQLKLRIGGSARQTKMFSEGYDAKEIPIIDKDGLQTGRYRTGDFNNITTTNDPYSDIPSSPAQTFHYVDIDLLPPQNTSKNPEPPQNLKYITNSLVYPTQTDTLCVNPEGEVLLITEALDTSRVIYSGKLSGDSKVTGLTFKFQAPAGGDSIQMMDFPTEPIKTQCLSAVEVHVEITSQKDGADIVKTFTESFILANFSYKIPLSCFGK